MGELYLYFSVWFDNCHEIPSFSPLIHLREKSKENDLNSEDNTKNDESISHDDDDLFDEKVTYEEYGHDDVPSDDLEPGLRPGPKGRPGVRLHGVRARTGVGTRAGMGMGAGAGGKSPLGPRSSARTWDNSESKGEHSAGQQHTPGKVRPVLSLYLSIISSSPSPPTSSPTSSPSPSPFPNRITWNCIHFYPILSVMFRSVLFPSVLLHSILIINFHLPHYTTTTIPHT